MSFDCTGWCRRIDLNFRALYPHLVTEIFRLTPFGFVIYVNDAGENFEALEKGFEEVRFITAPVKLVRERPRVFEEEIPIIRDDDISSGMSGFPMTISQIENHIECTHPDIRVSSIIEDHARHVITLTVYGDIDEGRIGSLKIDMNSLKLPYKFEVEAGGKKFTINSKKDEVFSIASALSQRHLNAEYLDRDERIWFDNIEKIYSGEFKKEDLFFFDARKTSCLVNYLGFKNVNIRNLILLYDVVYCILPLAEGMNDFLVDQKLSRDDILHLIERGRLKIITTQPLARLDYGLINEAYAVEPTAVVSRRAVSALCAIDLVEINKSYIFSSPGIGGLLNPFLKEISGVTKKPVDEISNFILWPKSALRNSLGSLGISGPMGVSHYGVNNILARAMPEDRREKLEFEFTVHSSVIHMSNALDATYFPFHVDNGSYSDHPYAVLMGGMLNFYKSSGLETISDLAAVVRDRSISESHSNHLMNIFEVNTYIGIQEFEREISSSVVRNGMNSIFSELVSLGKEERSERISTYNTMVDEIQERKRLGKGLLDVGEEAAGFFIPFLSLGKKVTLFGADLAVDKLPAIRSVADYISDKVRSADYEKKSISLLSKINRVARLRKDYGK